MLVQNDSEHNDKIIAQFTAQSKHFHSPEYSLSSQEYIQWALERMPLKRESNVIDVAAGTGLLSLSVSPFVQSVLALDITEAMLAEGRKAALLSGITNVTFRLGDAYHLEVPQSYDIAMSRLAFHHLSDPKAVLDQMQRVVVKGGSVIVCDLLSPEDPSLALRYNQLERMRDDSHTTSLTCDELTSMFHQSDMENIKVYYRYVINDLEAWMAMTATPETNREIIRRAIQDELQGRDKTGFSPFFGENGSVKFAHRWMMIMGTKR